MNKIINYILNGQGVGAKFLLIFSLILSLIFTAYFRIKGADMVPYAQSVADQILPIRIADGNVVEPADTIKMVNINFSPDSSVQGVPFIIDTTVDSLDTGKLSLGMYLTRQNFYLVNRNEVRMVRLNGNVELARGDYTDFFKSVLNWSVVFAAVFIFAFMFLFYFLLSMFYSLFTILVAKFFSKQYNFDQRMRLSVITMVSVYVAFFILEIGGLFLGKLVFFILTLVSQAVIISKMPTGIIAPVQETIPAATEKKDAE